MATGIRYSWDGSMGKQPASSLNGKDKFICTKQIFETFQSSSKLIRTKSPKLLPRTINMNRDSHSEPKLADAVIPSSADRKRMDVSAIILAFEERSKSTKSIHSTSMTSLQNVPLRQNNERSNQHHHNAGRPSSLVYTGRQSSSSRMSAYLNNYKSALTFPDKQNNNESGDTLSVGRRRYGSSQKLNDHTSASTEAAPLEFSNGQGDVHSSNNTLTESDVNNNSGSNVDDNLNLTISIDSSTTGVVVEDSNHIETDEIQFGSVRSKLETYKSLSESSSSVCNSSASFGTQAISSPRPPQTPVRRLHTDSKVQMLSQSFEELSTPMSCDQPRAKIQEAEVTSSSTSSESDQEDLDDEDNSYNIQVDEDTTSYDIQADEDTTSYDIQVDLRDDSELNGTYDLTEEPTERSEAISDNGGLDSTYNVNDIIMSSEDENEDDIDDNDDCIGLHYYQVPGLSSVPSDDDDDEITYHRYTPVDGKRRVIFSKEPMNVCLTYTSKQYDRYNDEADPVVATAEYELEKRLEKLIIFDVEIEKGTQPLGLSIVGIGVGADTGVEKLGMFVKTVVPGGSIHTDDRIKVNDQIIEVDGNSLVGVSQAYASSVLSSTKGIIYFKVGREVDPENSEIAKLVNQSILREQQFQKNNAASYEATTYDDESDDDDDDEYVDDDEDDNKSLNEEQQQQPRRSSEADGFGSRRSADSQEEQQSNVAGDEAADDDDRDDDDDGRKQLKQDFVRRT